MHIISTLDRLCRHLGMETGVDDARLLSSLQAASGQIERLTNRHYSPRLAARGHSIHTQYPSELTLDDDLLQLNAIDTNDGGSIDPDDMLRLPAAGVTGSLQLRDGLMFTWRDSPLLAVTVSGIWGWHSDWDAAWRDTDDGLLASAGASDRQLTVQQVDGADTAGESPRFQVGHLLRIDAEYMRVLAVESDPAGADTLTVQRGVNGTTAASHALNAPVYTYQPDPEVEHLVLRWAAWLYREPDARLVGDLPESLLHEAERWRRDGI